MIPPSGHSSPYRQQSPLVPPIRTGSPAVGYGRSGTLRPESPAQSPLEGHPRDRRRMRYETVSRSGSPHRGPGGIPSSRPGHSPQISVPSISVSQPPEQSQVHVRSVSMNAGSIPLRPGKPLSPLSTTLSLGDGLVAQPTLGRQPSATSLSSNHTSYKAFDPSEELDPAYLASSSAEYRPSPYVQHRSRVGRS